MNAKPYRTPAPRDPQDDDSWLSDPRYTGYYVVLSRADGLWRPGPFGGIATTVEGPFRWRWQAWVLAQIDRRYCGLAWVEKLPIEVTP